MWRCPRPCLFNSLALKVADVHIAALAAFTRDTCLYYMVSHCLALLAVRADVFDWKLFSVHSCPFGVIFSRVRVFLKIWLKKNMLFRQTAYFSDKVYEVGTAWYARKQTEVDQTIFHCCIGCAEHIGDF